MINPFLGKIKEAFDANPDLWVAIITGQGERAFCAGNDLRYQAEGGDRSAAPAAGFGGIGNRGGTQGVAQPLGATLHGGAAFIGVLQWAVVMGAQEIQAQRFSGIAL